MSLKTSEKQLFLQHQYSTGIFFYLHLLLPSILSINRQTHEESVGTDSEDFLYLSRNELLHLLLDALVASDEEDTLLSSILHNRRKNISLVRYRSNSFFQWERFSVKSQQVLFFVVLRSACRIFRIEFYRIFFDLIFWNFCFIVVQIHHELV